MKGSFSCLIIHLQRENKRETKSVCPSAAISLRQKIQTFEKLSANLRNCGVFKRCVSEMTVFYYRKFNHLSGEKALKILLSLSVHILK